jgi:hypothetical protein
MLNHLLVMYVAIYTKKPLQSLEKIKNVNVQILVLCCGLLVGKLYSSIFSIKNIVQIFFKVY